MLKKILSILTFVLILYTSGPSYSAIDKDKLNLRAELKLQHIFDNNLDLRTKSYGWRGHESAEIFLKGGIKLAKDFSSYVEVRGVLAPNGGLSEGVSGNIVKGGSFFEWREHWLLFDNILNVPGMSFQFGRQRLKEPSALWWDKNLDMMRIKYKSTLFEGFIGFGENLASYRTLHDDFLLKDKNRFRFLGEGIWHLGPYKTWQIRFLYEDDHSRTEPVGTVLKKDNIDSDDGQLFWLGARTTRDMYSKRLGYIKKINYNIDLIGLRGRNTHIKTVAGIGSNRTVSSIINKSVSAWAFDAITGFSADMISSPIFSLGYAFGSGSKSSSSNDNTFKQTGLNGSFTRNIGNSVGSIRKYGEVLKPDLSNIHILTAAINLPNLSFGDLNFLYHYYRLDKKATSISSKIDASLDGKHKYLGQAFDIVSNIDLRKQNVFGGKLSRDIYLEVALGSFISGAAYGTSRGNKAYRGSLSLWFKF